MEKLKMHSPNLTENNIARIREIFPNCITEGKDENGNIKYAIDFDLLKQELSANIVEGTQERYQLNWPGKKESLLTANAPIAKTLRPCIEESVDFENTKNIFIEGDNLDALKLLQESYLGKMKMIYFDPPYNTGEDFIYNDDLIENTKEFMIKSNQIDEQGNRMVANTEANGRFHSDWLSMMYPRLKLARNLLRNDGVIFISIGDEEVGSLRKICDEIFGENNFEGHIHWRRRHNQPNDKTKMIGLVAEHILSYAKDKYIYKKAGVGKVELTGVFSNPDNDQRGDWASKPWKVGSDQSGSKYKIITPAGIVYEEEWMGDKDYFDTLVDDKRIIYPDKGKGAPRKKYFKFERIEEGQCATNWWSHDQFGHNQEGNDELTSLMDGIKNTFSNPKPPRLIRNLMSLANCKSGDIVFDYFLGSGSTFQAALEYGDQLQFIGVQIPEILEPFKKAHEPAIEFCNKSKLKLTIAEITKERMRRVGKKIKEDLALKKIEQEKQMAKIENQINFSGEPIQESPILINHLDAGFRTLKVDTSNMADVFYTPDALKSPEMYGAIDNIKPGRSNEDLLFQALLDWNVPLSLPIRKERISRKDEKGKKAKKSSNDDFEVFFVDENALVACFDDNISEGLVRELANRKPLRVVFKDNGFESDTVKINTEQIFKQLSPNTVVKSI